MLRAKNPPKTKVSLPDNTHLFMILKYTRRFSFYRALWNQSFPTQQAQSTAQPLARFWKVVLLLSAYHPWETTSKHHTTRISPLNQSFPHDGPDIGFECLHGHTRNRHCPITVHCNQHETIRCGPTGATLNQNSTPDDRCSLIEPLQRSYSCLANASDTPIYSSQCSDAFPHGTRLAARSANEGWYLEQSNHKKRRD